MSKEIKSSCSDQSREVNKLHQASRAYLEGLHAEKDHVCPSLAEKENNDFLLMLSCIGLKEVLKCATKDQVLGKLVKEMGKARESQEENHDNIPNNQHHHHNNEDENLYHEHNHVNPNENDHTSDRRRGLHHRH